MRLGEIASGSAFRSAVLSLSVVLVVISAAGSSCYVVVRQALFSGLQAQLTEEVVLFGDIFKEGGVEALRSAVRTLESSNRGNQRVLLVDPNGARVAGGLDIAPAIVGLSATMQIVPNRSGSEVAVWTTRFQNHRLIVGRSIKPIRTTLQRLAAALILASTAVFVTIVFVGWIYSARSLRKLHRILEALRHVSRGDLSARTGPMRGAGQIETISVLIDESLDRLSKLVESSQNTIRALAHDLRSPLNRAIIRLEEAADAPADVRQDAVRSAIEELHRVGGIFDTVLRISSIEASGRANFRSVDLSTLVRKVVDLFEADLSTRGQTLTLALAESACVEGDEPALEQLLVNLLANANKHTPERTAVAVTVAREGPCTYLEVSDEGPGIEASQRTEVMKPFVRLDRSRSQEGSGLGLAMVQAIATRHDATVTLTDNAPGLRVRIIFPPAFRSLDGRSAD